MPAKDSLKGYKSYNAKTERAERYSNFRWNKGSGETVDHTAGWTVNPTRSAATMFS